MMLQIKMLKQLITLVKKETNQSVSSTTDKKDNTSSTNKKDNSTSSKVKTGDDTPLLALEIASTMSIIAGAIIVIKTKKKEN